MSPIEIGPRPRGITPWQYKWQPGTDAPSTDACQKSLLLNDWGKSEYRLRALIFGLSPVCGELLISPESAIRHTQESPVSNHEPYFASGARCWIYLSTPATLAMRA
jgi:hypothetical protein